MNRIEKVLSVVGYTIDKLTEVVERCPGTFLEGLPRINEKTCIGECNDCWESEVE